MLASNFKCFVIFTIYYCIRTVTGEVTDMQKSGCKWPFMPVLITSLSCHSMKQLGALLLPMDEVPHVVHHKVTHQH